VLRAVEEAELAQLVRPVAGRRARFAFEHALVRSTLYDELPTAQRLRMHRRVARALESRGDVEHALVELAYHYGECAALGEIDRAVAYAQRAGEAARATFAYEQAAVHFGQALNALDLDEQSDLDLRCDLLIARGDALRRAGDAAFAEVLTEAEELAETAGDGRRFGRAVLARNLSGLASATGEVDREIVERISHALELLGDADGALRARLLAVLAGELMWNRDLERRVALCDEALTLARASGDTRTLADALISAHESLSTPTNLDDRLAIDAELLDLAARTNDLDIEFSAHRYHGEELLELGDRAGWYAASARAGEVADQLRHPLAQWSMEVHWAGRALLHGDFDAAARHTDAMAAVGRQGQVPEAVYARVWAALVFLIAYEQGELERLAPFMNEVPPSFETALALLYLETGCLDEARAIYETYARDGFATLAPDFTWYYHGVICARIAVALGKREDCLRLSELFDPVAGRWAWFGIAAMGPVDLTRAVLAACIGHDDDAGALFESAVRLADDFEAEPYAARARADWAAFLIARHEDARGRELARDALARAEALGMRGVAAQCRALLA
jgi:hypothetical protein